MGLEFENRRDEVSGIVADFIIKSELWVGEQPEDVRQAASIKAKAEQEAFKGIVPAYFDIRDVELTRLVEEMAKIATPDSDPDSIWKAPVATLAGAARDRLETILRGIEKPTDLATGYQYGISAAEKIFADGLRDVGIASAWKAIAYIRQDDFAFVVGLASQWKLLKDKAVEIYQKASPYSTRIADVVDHSPGSGGPIVELLGEGLEIEKVTNRAANAGEKLADLRSAADSAFADYRRALDGVERFAQGWQLTIDQARQDVAMLRTLQSAEIEALHRVFKERRKEAQAFRDEPSHEAIKRVIEEARSRWTSWAGGLGWEGMRRDSDELIGELLKPLYARMDESRKDLDAFVSTWDGIFVGSVDDDTAVELARDDDWDDLRRRFVDERPPDVLMTIKKQIDAKEVDAEALVKALEDMVALRSADAEADRKAFAEMIARQRSELVPKFLAQRNLLRRVCDDGYALLAGSELAAVMDRRDVLASLRA